MMERMLRWREAEPADVEALLALVQSAYRGSGGWTSEAGLIEGERIDAGELLAEIESPAAVVMVVPGAGGLTACGVLRPGAAGDAHFGLFAVDPSRQGSGIGRGLLSAARRLARERFGAEALEISVVSGQPALTAWYERLGFTLTGVTVPFPEDPSDRPLVPGLHFVGMRAPTRRPPHALFWSGGKDSALALHALTADGESAPSALLTTVDAEDERIATHGVRRELLRRQAQAIGIELVEVTVPRGAPNAIYERSVTAALRVPPLAAVQELAFGDLFLRDVRAYREHQCAAAGRRPRFPLWGRDTRALAERFLALGFRARVVCLDPRRVSPSLAGREYDAEFLAELPAGVDPCGENGEFHTFVYDGPVLRAPVPWRLGQIHDRDGFVLADLRPIP
jgi:uncharacterized protein (TIGR00290 family)